MPSSDRGRGPFGEKVSRRELLKTGAAAAAVAAGIGLGGCSQEAKEKTADTEETVTPSATPSRPAATLTAIAAATASSLMNDQGGIREVAPGTIFFPAFGNVTALITGEGVIVIDTSLVPYGANIAKELRKRTDLPIRKIIYTHGHLDHVGGAKFFLQDAEDRGDARPAVIGHKLIANRLQRYERMEGWLNFIASFQWNRPVDPNVSVLPLPFVYPDTTYDDKTTVTLGGEAFQLIHALGETDDHTWIWSEKRSLVVAGDFFIWACPNVGNPWKVQRYAVEWADALEAIAAVHPNVFIPGHGSVIEGEASVQAACLDTARYLRSIAEQVVERMNKGQWLEQILREVEPPADLVDKPYLQPVYGHPKFIVQGVWRQYGGWYDGDPADFFPAPTADHAAEIVKLAGGGLLSRACELQVIGDLPFACHLVDCVRKADPANRDALALWRDLFQTRATLERNLMSRNTFALTAAEAESQMT